MSQKDFYHEIFQERRCQVGLHNFPTYKNSNEVLICKRCKFMQLPSADRFEFIHKEKTTIEEKIKNTFKNMNIGYECRDGTINYNKTWD